MRQDDEPNIRVYIDRLILDGLPVDRIHALFVQMAVEAELRRLLVQSGLSTELMAGGRVPSVHANVMQLSTGSNPSRIGTKIAQSIFSGIGNMR